MSFNSILFLIFFLPVFMAIYYICPKQYRFLVLLLFSVIFYYYAGLMNLGILIIAAIVNYLFGLFTGKNKVLFAVSIIFNISLLCFFKYNRNYLLPLGMSFYTFNNLSYLIDVYKGECNKENNPLYYMTYALMFPTISMGPLSDYSIIRNNLNDLKWDTDRVSKGVRRFVIGLIKKCIVADNLGDLYGNLLSANDKSILMNLVMIIVFGIQLYIDFSSYSDMAIGIGQMIGLEYKENFDYPYMSDTITYFWRRWHMSLNRFFTKYVYIPLGGNRVSTFRHIINIMIVWLLTGIWHGSSFNFVIWGIYYGIILILEKNVLKDVLEKMPKALKHLYVLIIVFIGYIFFSSKNLSDIGYYFVSMFRLPFISNSIVFYLKENAVLLIVSILLCFRIPERIRKTFNSGINAYILDATLILLFILSLSYILSGKFLPFLYGAF